MEEQILEQDAGTKLFYNSITVTTLENYHTIPAKVLYFDLQSKMKIKLDKKNYRIVVSLIQLFQSPNLC
jgi:hypothetical protein